jgi:pyruvate/2-oxoacid:ferredoxin oxidoreductase beta subunit
MRKILNVAVFAREPQSLGQMSRYDITVQYRYLSPTFTGQSAKMAAFGKASPGTRERCKELATIAMTHPDVYVAQTTPAHLNHFYRAVMEANEYPGPAVVIAYASCILEHGIADEQAVAQAKLTADSRTFPLLIYDPHKGERIRERLSLQGNPMVKEDWFTHPKTSEPIDFIAPARYRRALRPARRRRAA